MLKDEDFSNTAKVDRYGRKLSNEGKKKALERLYVPDEEPEVEEDDVVEEELKKADAGLGDARYRGFESSEDDSEEEDEDEDGGVAIAEEAFPDMQADQSGVEMGEVTSRFAVCDCVGLWRILLTITGCQSRLGQYSLCRPHGCFLKFCKRWENPQSFDIPERVW